MLEVTAAARYRVRARARVLLVSSFVASPPRVEDYSDPLCSVRLGGNCTVGVGEWEAPRAVNLKSPPLGTAVSNLQDLCRRHHSLKVTDQIGVQLPATEDSFTFLCPWPVRLVGWLAGWFVWWQRDSAESFSFWVFVLLLGSRDAVEPGSEC